MNAWLTWRPDARLAQAMRAVVRRGTRVSHHLFSIVGVSAVLLAVALWLMPTLRGTLAAKIMPFVSAAVQAGPARLLQGNPLPAINHDEGPSDDTLSVSSNTVPGNTVPGNDAVTMSGPPASQAFHMAPATYDSTPDASGPGTNVSALNGLDPRTLPSVGDLARLIPAQRVAADARDDRVLISTREQDLVASYLSRRYRVAQQPVGALVRTAFDTGREVGLDPLLLLAVMAIESGFNPYAESGVGAQGLMQVMSKVHSDKFNYFGGERTALEPITNIKVGALVLKDCIARGGSLAGGLRLYVGSTSQDDGGYGAKVMAERGRLRDVARGVKVPINAPQAPVTTTASSTPAAVPSKRVTVSLDAAHPLAATKTAAASQKADQDDASTNAAPAAKHASSSSEFGA
jgi:hypothetical protein